MVGVCWIISTDVWELNDGEVDELTTGGISTSQLGQLLLWLRRQLAKWRMGPPQWSPSHGASGSDRPPSLYKIPFYQGVDFDAKIAESLQEHSIRFDLTVWEFVSRAKACSQVTVAECVDYSTSGVIRRSDQVGIDIYASKGMQILSNIKSDVKNANIT